MLTNVSKLELKIGQKTFQLYCDMTSTTLEVKEALFGFIKFVGNVEDEAKAKLELEQSMVMTEDKPSEVLEEVKAEI